MILAAATGMRIHRVIAPFALLAGLTAPAFAEKASDVVISKAKKAATTNGTVRLNAPPTKVYAALTDYKNWIYLFSDVRSVTVRSGGAEDASVRFKSAALGHTVTIKFQNVKDSMVSFALTDGPPGARASGTFVLLPAVGGETTIVQATLYMDAVGVAGWFLTDKSIRNKREKKLRTDLQDLARRFPFTGGDEP